MMSNPEDPEPEGKYNVLYVYLLLNDMRFIQPCIEKFRV